AELGLRQHLAQRAVHLTAAEPALGHRRLLRRPGTSAWPFRALARVGLLEVERPEPLVQLGEAAHHAERRSRLAPDDVALEVPGHVLAQLAQCSPLVVE